MSLKHCAIFPGSFDPMHKGHINIIKRASKLFNCIYVVVSNNIDKNYTKNIQDRYDDAKKAISKLKLHNVHLVINNGMTVNVAKKLKCNYIIRSIRNSQDVEYELNMAQNNNLLSNEIETIFFVADSKLKDISSTNRKELTRQKLLIKKR